MKSYRIYLLISLIIIIESEAKFVQEDDLHSDGLLKPAFGIHFKRIGDLQPSSDYYFISLHVELPFNWTQDLTYDRIPSPQWAQVVQRTS